MTMTSIKRFIPLLFILLLCPSVFGAVGLTPSTGSPSCGAIQDGQDLCGTGPATFESNATGECPAGTFADIGRWGCYTCPDGFDRGIAAVDSDRACTRESTNNQLERFVSATKVGTACPSGSFFDPIREGECWTCPSGFIRSAANIDWADACVILAKEVFSRVTEHSLGTGLIGTDCPPQTIDLDNFPNLTNKQFWDGIDGKCHSCPSGYTRTGYSVHDSRACSKVISADHSRATLKGQAKCGDGEISDFFSNPEQGGNCYVCPAAYDRTVFPIEKAEACETTPEIEFSLATKTTDLTCPVNQIFDFISTNNADVKRKLIADGVSTDDYQSDDLGTCWSCPPGGTRSWSSVTADDACVLSDLGWNMPIYEHIGLFGLKGATQVILDIINEQDNIIELAEGYAAVSTELTNEEFTQEVWQEISQNPEQSSLLAIAAFARLQSYADRSDLKSYEREFLDDFQQQVTNYQSAMAQEALNILKVWQEGAFLRYIDPRFNNLPEVVLQKLFWLSIGVVSPPVSPPDFSALIYEIAETPEVDVLVLGMTAAERSIDHGILTTLFPNDLVGDLAGNVSDTLKDKLLSRVQDELISAITRQAQKEAAKAGAKVSAKMILLGPPTLGPQIAVALFIEYTTQWVDFIAGATDAEPKLKANLAQAQQIYSVSRKLMTEEGSLDLRHHFKTIMNSRIAPSAADKLSIEQAVAVHSDYTLTFLASPGGSVDTNTLPIGYDGTSSTVNALADTGFVFINWTDSTGLNISNSAELIIRNVTASQTYTANFSIDTNIVTVNGSCGDSHQTLLLEAPSNDLCASGSANDVSGTGPWNWNCNGSNGGTNTTCSALATDTILPIVKAPLSIEVFASMPNGSPSNDVDIRSFLDSATASDNIDGDIPVTHNAPATFPLGITVVTFSAIDNSDNTSSAQAIVTVIDGPPIVIAPADLTINATGLRTKVLLGNAIATDALEGELTANANTTGPFKPGIHYIVWSAVDTNGNTGEAIQTLSVRPLANFAIDQIADNKGGTTAIVKAFLNGAAADYPVTIPYTVTGTANNPTDHDLFAGNIVINSGLNGSIMFNLVDHEANAENKTIILTMGEPSNAAIGTRKTHIVTLSDVSETAPLVTLTLDQNGLATNSIATSGNGLIVATASLRDTSVTSTYLFDWDKTNALLADLDITDNTFTFDPSALKPGIYQLAVSVSDNNNSSLISSGLISLSIQAEEPALSSDTDSDGDGKDDASEGYGDTDNDGIPDFLDAIDQSNVLSGKRGNSNAFLMETHSGMHLRLGSIAIGSGTSQVSSSEVSALSQSPADDIINVGGLFDYEVSNLASIGQTIDVVIPQIAQVPANPVYRNLVAGNWSNFIESNTEKVSSAQGSEGYCPPVGDSRYTAGLNSGHWCVQLSIQDGGPNDADGEENNRVVNLGGVGSKKVSKAAEAKKKSGGAISFWLLGLLAVLAFGRRLRSRAHRINHSMS